MTETDRWSNPRPVQTGARLGYHPDVNRLSCSDLPREPDAIAAWSKLDLVTGACRSRMEEGGARSKG
jgi:hypothetical protein